MTRKDTDEPLQRALIQFQRGALREARILCERLLLRHPAHLDALRLLGVIQGQSGDPARAAVLFERASRLDPDDPHLHCMRGVALQSLGRYEPALASFVRALELKPDYHDAETNRGGALLHLERWDDAIASFDRAIALAPADSRTWSSRGNAFAGARRWEAALVSYDRALEFDPEFADAYSNRGNVLLELKRWDEALSSFERAIALRPGFAAALYNRGNALRELGRNEAAVASFDAALALTPDYTDAWHNRGNALQDLQRFSEAAESYERVLALDPQREYMLGSLRHVRMQICDWREHEPDIARIAEGLATGKRVTPPFPTLSMLQSAAQQRLAAEIWVHHRHPPDHSLGSVALRSRAARIRIAYLSGDFHEHPVSRLMAGVFETHDRSRFEISAISFGPDVNDPMRTRLRQTFEEFVDVRAQSDAEVAALLRRMQIDIAVDLAGHTRGSRPGILALRAAPLQLGYIGYLGTLGAPYIDYLIADPVVVPADHWAHYSEKMLYLPSYQANDSARRASDRAFTREEVGLTAAQFVYCCFNTSYKITPATFSAWMRILARVPRSVLLLQAASDTVERNLKAEARLRDVDPVRLVFAPRLDFADYLSRLSVADLFLDTLPYNAGATASDALWAGLPVLTCRGETFAGRMGASLLTAMGMRELIAPDLEAYEDLAVALATDPVRLERIRRELIAGRDAAALFDSATFTRHLEAGYAAICERALQGLSPVHIEIDSANQVRVKTEAPI